MVVPVVPVVHAQLVVAMVDSAEDLVANGASKEQRVLVVAIQVEVAA